MTSILTIGTPASVRALTLRATVAADLGIATPGANDSWVDAEISAASSAIEAWCGTVFARETVTETWRDVCADLLVLSRFPVVSITSVVADGVTLTAGDYELDGGKGFLWALSADTRTPWRAAKIAVTYVAGYLLPGQTNRDLPADIERACRMIVVSSYEQRGRDVMIRSEGAQGIGQVSYLDPRGGMEAFPPQAAGLLAPYRSLRA